MNVSAHPRLSLPPIFFGILALPMLVVIGSEALLSTFADTTVLPDVTLIDAPELPELVGRYRFLSIFFLYVAVCLTILGVFAFALTSHFSKRTIIAALLSIVGLFAFSTLYTLWEPEWMGSFDSYELLGSDLFTRGLGLGSMPLCEAGGCEGKGAFYAMRWGIAVINILSALAISAVVVGMILCLSRPGPIDLSTSETIVAEARELERAQAGVKRYLYLSGVLLSVGMMFGFGWMMWPAKLLADPEQAGHYSDLVQAISLYRGVSYSVLILSFYMPISLIQAERIASLNMAAQEHDAETLLTKVKSFKIEGIATLEAFKTILTILSPILAGALGAFTGVDVLSQ